MSLDRYRTAIVTGASRGIGAAIVRQLQIGGIEVWAVARSADDLADLARETGCRPMALDITHRDAVLGALSGLEADILVNNASALVRGGVSWETAPDDIDALMSVNIKGMLNCLAATVPGMKARGLGHIVNLGSIASVAPIPGMPVYAMTKAAIRNLGQTLRLDLHGTGVRVSEISPGRVETGAHLALLEDREEGRRRFYEGFDCLQPDDIAEAVMFVLGAPQRMDVNYMEIVPTDQSYGGSQFQSERIMSLKNLATILDPTVQDERPLIVQLSPEGDEELRLSYGEGRRRIAALARGLLKRGLKRGEAVAIVAANSADYLILYMATMAAGLVSVCVNHKLPRETVAHIMKNSAVKLAVADGERAPLVSALVPTVAIEQLDTMLDPGPFTPVDMTPEEVAMVLYTSGSTGLPKGVPLTHGGYVWATGATPEQRPAIEGKKAIIAAPLFHMNGLFSAKMVMINGGTIVLLTTFTARGYIRAIDRLRIDMVTSVPTMLALVMRETEALAQADLTCVTTAVTGSAPSTPEFFEQMHRLFPNAETANSWGTTESGPLGFGRHPDGVPKPLGALGYPRKGIEVKFVGGDPDQGVLHIRTPALMTGYLNREADTRKRLIDGWYDTGDVMRRDKDGFVFFVGRADDMFQCGGENVYPGEVEKLLGRHPEVAQACVVPVDDEIKYQLPVAFVVPRPGTKPSEDALRRFALDNGPAYAHPRAVWFVDELPLAGTNKIDRKALVERAAANYARGATRRV